MNIAVVGSGYVGLVSGACLAEMGNRVVCVDTNEQKIQALRKGEVPIYEPGLQEMVVRNQKREQILFTTSLKEALSRCEVLFIAVGTPMGEDGGADLQYVLGVAKEIGVLLESPLVVVNKSTVPVGTADKVESTIRSELNKRNIDISFDVVSNPEFLKEGAAIQDFMRPDRIVVGAKTKEAFALMREVYAPFIRNHDRLIEMSVRSAEMTKYAANAMLALKISFINEIANICEAVGADVNEVRIGIGSDNRIGYSFIYPGCGYGGSCFPKDVKALEKIAKDVGVESKMITATKETNQAQKQILFRKIQSHFKHLEGRLFGIWGLSFKPETDDMREASSIDLIHALLNAGARVAVYDPKAMKEAQEFYFKGLQGIEYKKSKYETLDSADAMVLVTEWKEFRSPDFYEIKARLKKPVIFDGRNQYNPQKMQKFGISYYQIGTKAILQKEHMCE
ncbi:UDP-glucose 6-dehydrogenase [Helicobacter monodelphidis]|uniref:UDP-glucose dehydrogenase family protein n=1 Tax=Helicobacter sp. 15-1451 TaxID=2004995 RepID=UPI000DCD0220|nr:UDP-glucose/GDP-mannose dehydrogenase family protein [Helicobacter sp. 15-1451]RAX58647.1 UDP-glucose 6-dehydrogenase [Helicobacter sp. 15-1451]